ncbi:uncharacterized protein LOC143228815 [Tachypleus tridentatus]|uniref:uncharacterized protein LOC143228815 n=1 Tax=Tachypleus tridentatus TaxID=6853 RepID=UPI003FD60EF1
MATMTSFRNRLTQLEARLKAENDHEQESRNTSSRDLRPDMASSRPTTLKVKGLPIGQGHGSLSRPAIFPASQRTAMLPLSLPPHEYSLRSQESTNYQMESKLRKIYQHAGTLTIDGMVS